MMKEQSMYDIVDNIVNVVFYKYFSYVTNPQVKQDLFQEGYLKAYELLESGNYDPSMPLRNFIYTGVRNAMTNYMYHSKKETHVDLSELDKYENIVGVYDIDDYDIDVKLIHNICDTFKEHGDFFVPVMEYLKKIGLTNIRVEHKEQELNPMITEAVITLVIWEMYYKEMNK